MEDYDYIIVGGGSAGCVIANRLSADPDCRVLLIDAGRSDRHLFVRVPAAMGLIMSRDDMVWRYMANADASRDGREEMWPAGRCLGGGSAINGMMFVRGHRYDYDHWAALGNTGWGYEDVLPYFRRLETNERGANEFRGGDGPLSVAEVRVKHPLIDNFIMAAREIGIAYNDDLNGESQEGVGHCQALQRRGLRHTTAAAYIWPAKRPNLEVRLSTFVNRVILDNGRAVGVEYRTGKETATVTARRGVVLSAGALVSPKLLMLSGIGSRDELAAHGIDVQHELPGVGENLQEHPGIIVRAHMNIPTLNTDTGPLRALRHGFDYLLDGSGPLSTPIGHAQAFVRTREGLPAPNIQIIFSVFAHELAEDGARPYPRPAISIAVGLCRVGSRGRIRLRSSAPEDHPVIDYQLLSADDDVRQLVEGGKMVRQMLATKALSPYVEEEDAPGDAVESESEWMDYVHRTSILMYHPCGSCRMGQDEMAVVDANLRVRGLTGLWVADASIIPTIPAGNINATCIMIGEKASDLIHADR